MRQSRSHAIRSESIFNTPMHDTDTSFHFKQMNTWKLQRQRESVLQLAGPTVFCLHQKLFGFIVSFPPWNSSQLVTLSPWETWKFLHLRVMRKAASPAKFFFKYPPFWNGTKKHRFIKLCTCSFVDMFSHLVIIYWFERAEAFIKWGAVRWRDSNAQHLYIQKSLYMEWTVYACIGSFNHAYLKANTNSPRVLWRSRGVMNLIANTICFCKDISSTIAKTP